MRPFSKIVLMAVALLAAACSNEVEFHEAPIIYNHMIVDNYPMLWSVQHQPERDDGTFFLDFSTNERPLFNNNQYILVGTYGGIMALDMETGQELWYNPINASISAEAEIPELIGVMDYILSENSEFIILDALIGIMKHLLIRINLHDGSEQWRIKTTAKHINDNYEGARVGDSHLYLSILNSSGTCYDAYKLDMQTGDTTRLLHTALYGDYTDTQCFINTITHNDQELWLVTEGWYNASNEDEKWRMHLRNPETGDTLSPLFEPMSSKIPSGLDQRKDPGGIAQLNNNILAVYTAVWFNTFHIGNLLNKEGEYRTEMILPNANPSGYADWPTTHQIIGNLFIFRTRDTQWLMEINHNPESDELPECNIIRYHHVTQSTNYLPTSNHNMIDGIFYESCCGLLQAFELESSKQLMKVKLSGLGEYTGTMAYKNNKGEVFVVCGNRDEVKCYPGLTSSHHKMDILDYIKNKTNIR